MPDVLGWGAAAADAFGYPAPDAEWTDAVLRRLPGGLLVAIDSGVSEGLVDVQGYQFTLPVLGPGKGPYSWFSRSSRSQPAPNWEYFVQVALWLDLVRTLPVGTQVGFEDELMDVSVRSPDGSVLWCVEVKERADQLPPLIAALRRHGARVEMDAPDRSDDPLRKAKYLLRQQPPWFSAAALGARYDFAVITEGAASFRLEPDVVPLALLGPGRQGE